VSGPKLIRFALDEELHTFLKELKEEYVENHHSVSLPEFVEILMVRKNDEITLYSLINAGHIPNIFDPPPNSYRIPIRVRNTKLEQELQKISADSGRGISKVIYSIMRLILVEKKSRRVAKTLKTQKTA